MTSQLVPRDAPALAAEWQERNGRETPRALVALTVAAERRSDHAAAMLQRGGWDCEVLRDEHGVLDALGRTWYDLMVCEVDATDEDLTLVRRAAALAEGMPVILTAARATTGSALAAIELPVIAYLVEPIDLDALLARADRALARSQMVRAVRAAERELEAWRGELGSRATPESTAAVSTALDGFMARTLRNVMGSLADLEHARLALARERAPVPHACQPLNCPRGAQLREAVRHTIAVLESTKGSFRSRTLADLRHRLELLLEHN